MSSILVDGGRECKPGASLNLIGAEVEVLEGALSGLSDRGPVGGFGHQGSGRVEVLEGALSLGTKDALATSSY